MAAINFQYPTRYVLEAGCFRLLGERAALHGRKAALVTGKSAMRRAGILDRAIAMLRENGVEVSLFEGVPPNPIVEDVDRCAEFVRSRGCDLVIALGGASSMDVAKIAAFLARQGGSAWDYANMPERPAKKIGPDVLPLVLVPTTAGTASETTPFAVLTNRAIPMKKGVSSPHLYARESLVDPELHLLMPREMTGYTGLDGLTQCLESWISAKADLKSLTFAREGFRHLWEALPKVIADPRDLDARTRVAWGVSLSGLAITSTDVNLAHAMSHPLSARYDLTHGLAVALMTPAALSFTIPRAPEKFVELAQAIGVDASARELAATPERVIRPIRAFMERCGVRFGLSHHGVPRTDIPFLAAEAMQIGAIKTNPAPIAAGEVEGLFALAWGEEVSVGRRDNAA